MNSNTEVMYMTERTLTSQELQEFREFADAARRLLSLDATAGPKESVEAIEGYILDWHQPKGNFFTRLFNRKPDVIQAALALGAIWGEQLVREFGWDWTCHQAGGQDLYCVASKNRSTAVFPTYFVKACLDDASVDCTIVLAFNMLKAGSLPELPAGAFLNLMDGVHRIVPR
jgi:hypothetical protein